MKIPTLGGDKIEMHPNQRLTFSPTFEKEIDGKSTRLGIRARSITEMHDRLRDIKRRHPKLDLEEMLSLIESQKVYVNDPMTLTIDCGGPESARAMVKSTVALAFDAGADIADCDLALEYLRNQDAEQCFYAYYEKDLVRNREPGMPLHCVYVAGSPHDRSIMGYVELYGVIRPVFPILGVFRLNGQPKRDGSIIVRSCKATQSPVYPIRDAILAVNHASCPSLSSSGPRQWGESALKTSRLLGALSLLARSWLYPPSAWRRR